MRNNIAKLNRSFLIFLLVLIFSGCENTGDLEYKYTSEKDLFECKTVNMDLIKEAVYAFENYVKDNYSFRGPNTVAKGHANYWSVATTDRLPNIEKLDGHVINVYTVLLKEKDLWIKTNDKITLDHNSVFFNCMVDHMINEDAKLAMSNLLKTNTYRSEIFTPVMKRNTRQLLNDKGLATYVALELFYAKLYKADISTEN
jgi:hypothetical protein